MTNSADYIIITGLTSQEDREVLEFMAEFSPNRLGVVYVVVTAEEEVRQTRMSEEAWNDLTDDATEGERRGLIKSLPCKNTIQFSNDYDDFETMEEELVPEVIHTIHLRRETLCHALRS